MNQGLCVTKAEATVPESSGYMGGIKLVYTSSHVTIMVTVLRQTKVCPLGLLIKQ